MAQVLWLPCDEGTGTTLVDYAGNGLDMTPGDATSWLATDRGTVPSLNGTSDNLQNSSWGTYNPTAAITVACWVRGPSQDNQIIISHYDTGSNQRSWSLGTSNSTWIGNTNKLGVIISQDGQTASNYKAYESGVTAFDDTWHHVAFTFTSNTLLLYINGQADVGGTAVVNGTVSALHDSTANLMIGALFVAGSPSNFYEGEIDNVVVWDSVLTAAQIQDEYAREARRRHHRRLVGAI